MNFYHVFIASTKNVTYQTICDIYKTEPRYKPPNTSRWYESSPTIGQFSLLRQYRPIKAFVLFVSLITRNWQTV